MLTIIVPEAVIDEPDMIELAGRFHRRSASNEEHHLGTIYRFSHMGENKFTPEAYAICHTYGCILDGAMMYHVFQDADKDNEVPETYPSRLDADGNPLTYAQYFRQDTQYDLGDGTTLFRIMRGSQALSDADRRVYEADLGTLLVKAEGVALIPQPAE